MKFARQWTLFLIVFIAANLISVFNQVAPAE